jgi:uncharacterized protein YuzE
MLNYDGIPNRPVGIYAETGAADFYEKRYKAMTFSYDELTDVLYITFEKSVGRVTYTENDEGDVLRMDEKSGKIVGVTITFFLRRAREGPIIVPEVGVVPFNQIANNLLSERKHEKSH